MKNGGIEFPLAETATFIHHKVHYLYTKINKLIKSIKKS